VGENDFQKLKDAGLKGNIENCSRQLFACGGREIEVAGRFKAEIGVTYWGKLLPKSLVFSTSAQRPVPCMGGSCRVTLPTSSKLNTLKFSRELAS